MRPENDFVLVYGWKLPRFLYGNRNYLFLCVRNENDLFLVWGSIEFVFVWVVEIDLVVVCGPKMTWSCVGIEIDLVFGVSGRN